MQRIRYAERGIMKMEKGRKGISVLIKISRAKINRMKSKKIKLQKYRQQRNIKQLIWHSKKSKKLEQLSFMQIIQMKLKDGMYIGRKGKKKENLDLIRMCLQVFLQMEK